MTEKDLNIKVRDDGVYILETENYRFHLDEKTHIEKIGKIINENEELKQRINSRLHFYRELYESTNDNVVKRVIEDLEDILK